jgi:hypothetical protein
VCGRSKSSKRSSSGGVTQKCVRVRLVLSPKAQRDNATRVKRDQELGSQEEVQRPRSLNVD